MVLFAGSVFIELVYILLFLLTIRRPGFRFWPPPSAHSWQFFAAWILASLVSVGFFFTGLLDFNSGPLAVWRSAWAGLAVHIIGGMLGSWAFGAFGLRAVIGLGDELVTGGPYRFSRNPQYIADSLHILGFVLITNSWMAALIGLLGIVLNLLAPFTEEPWLEEKFGVAYRDYQARVPRFF
jgi:protein-S-isoprenylcysteine O-methyltransferase Ste14